MCGGRDMLQTHSVVEASVMVVDGICLMLTDRSADKCSQSRSVSEYNRHFYVCNTRCGSFFFFVGKTGNTHTHDVARCKTNTWPVENRRRIDAL